MAEKLIDSTERERTKKILEAREKHGDEWSEYSKKSEVVKNPAREVLDAIPLFKKHGVKKIIDIGCGGGRNSFALAKQGFDVTALNISRESLKAVSRRVMEEKLENVHPLRGDAWKIPAQDGTFDAAVSYRVLDVYIYETPERREAVREMARVLKLGGDALVVGALLREELDELLEAFKDAKIKPASVEFKDIEGGGGAWVIKAKKLSDEPPIHFSQHPHLR